MYFLHVLDKNEILAMICPGLSENRKINSQQEKPVCLKIAKIGSGKTKKNGQSAKINSRQNFVPHGI